MNRPICGTCPDCRAATLRYLGDVKAGKVKPKPRAPRRYQ